MDGPEYDDFVDGWAKKTSKTLAILIGRNADERTDGEVKQMRSFSRRLK